MIELIQLTIGMNGSSLMITPARNQCCFLTIGTLQATKPIKKAECNQEYLKEIGTREQLAPPCHPGCFPHKIPPWSRGPCVQPPPRPPPEPPPKRPAEAEPAAEAVESAAEAVEPAAEPAQAMADTNSVVQ